MLDSFIIEEIKRRERLRRERHERPAIELPLPLPDDPPNRRDGQDEDKPQRGVVIIDLAV